MYTAFPQAQLHLSQAKTSVSYNTFPIVWGADPLAKEAKIPMQQRTEKTVKLLCGDLLLISPNLMP